MTCSPEANASGLFPHDRRNFMAHQVADQADDSLRLAEAIARWDSEGGALPGGAGLAWPSMEAGIGGKVFTSNSPARAAELRRVVDDGRTRTFALAFLNARLAANDRAKNLDRFPAR
jgi:hypothetical protein